MKSHLREGEDEKKLYFRPPVSEADLYAIRPYKKGRLAVFYCCQSFHFGQGTKWLLDGVMLDKGLNGKPSDFARLFQNTLQWLTQPARELGQLGGAKVDPDHILPAQLQPGAKDLIDNQRRTTPAHDLR